MNTPDTVIAQKLAGLTVMVERNELTLAAQERELASAKAKPRTASSTRLVSDITREVAETTDRVEMLREKLATARTLVEMIARNAS